MNLPVQLQNNEEVISVIKRHPASLWGRLALIAVIFIVVLVLWINFGLGEPGAVNTTFDILFIVAILGCALAAFSVWYRYNNNIWMVTSQRLIDSTRNTPFSQQVTTAALGNVQDISIRKKGVFQASLNYGDVLCQTASASGTIFAFRGVANPEKVLEVFDDARSKANVR